MADEQSNGGKACNETQHKTPKISILDALSGQELQSKRMKVVRTDNIGKSEGCPVKHENETSRCPVQHDKINPMNMMEYPDESVNPNQRIPLSTTRSVSSIPKGEYTPNKSP